MYNVLNIGLAFNQALWPQNLQITGLKSIWKYGELYKDFMIFHLLVVQLKSMDQIWPQISWQFLNLNPTHTFRYEGAMELKAIVKCHFNQKH